MSTSPYKPTDIALALGLAAIGRYVLVVRPDEEKLVELARAVLDQLSDRGGEGYGRFSRTTKRMNNEHSGGCVVFVNREQIRRREINGLQFHHVFGLENVTEEEQAVYVMTRVRLEVKP